MISTPLTTWTRIFRLSTFEDGYNADPNNEIDLTDEQREEFLTDCRAHLIAEADKVLAPYNAEILSNGDILGDHNSRDAFDEALENGDLKEELGMIDFEEVVNTWLDRLDA